MELEQVVDLLAQCIRLGTVTGRDAATLRVQVTCADTVTAALVTDWLPVLVPRANEDRQYDLPDMGDRVLCLFLPHGREAGFVLGSLYSGDAPPVQDGDKWHRVFKDGTTLEYDRKANRLAAVIKGSGILEVECDGPADLKAKGPVLVQSDATITLKAPHIVLQGNLTQTDVSGGPATSELRGTFTVRDGSVHVPDQDVTAQSISLVGHVHEGVEPGSATTGEPT